MRTKSLCAKWYCRMCENERYSSLVPEITEMNHRRMPFNFKTKRGLYVITNENTTISLQFCQKQLLMEKLDILLKAQIKNSSTSFSFVILNYLCYLLFLLCFMQIKNSGIFWRSFQTFTAICFASHSYSVKQLWCSVRLVATNRLQLADITTAAFYSMEKL